MSRRLPIIPPPRQGIDPPSLVAIARIIDRPVCETVVGAPGGDNVTAQVTVTAADRNGRPRIGESWVVRVWTATSDGGGPAGSQTVSVTTGTILTTITSNQQYDVLTDPATGTVVLEVTATPTTSRWIGMAVQGSPAVWSGELEFTP